MKWVKIIIALIILISSTQSFTLQVDYATCIIKIAGGKNFDIGSLFKDIVSDDNMKKVSKMIFDGLFCTVSQSFPYACFYLTLELVKDKNLEQFMKIFSDNFDAFGLRCVNLIFFENRTFIDEDSEDHLEKLSQIFMDSLQPFEQVCNYIESNMQNQPNLFDDLNQHLFNPIFIKILFENKEENRTLKVVNLYDFAPVIQLQYRREILEKIFIFFFRSSNIFYQFNENYIDYDKSKKNTSKKLSIQYFKQRWENISSFLEKSFGMKSGMLVDVTQLDVILDRENNVAGDNQQKNQQKVYDLNDIAVLKLFSESLRNAKISLLNDNKILSINAQGMKVSSKVETVCKNILLPLGYTHKFINEMNDNIYIKKLIQKKITRIGRFFLVCGILFLIKKYSRKYFYQQDLLP